MKTMLLSLLILCGSVSVAMPDEPIAPDATSDESSSKLTIEESKLFELTNAERKRLNLPPLRIDPGLMKIARAHATNMARLDMLGHDLEGQTFSQRLEQAKYQAAQAGENIAQGQRTPEEAVADWMRSPGHKANILQVDYTHAGMGLATAKSGQTYLTQVFSKPVDPRPESPDQNSDQKEKSQEWRVLLVIKPQTAVTIAGNPSINAKLSQENIAAVKRAFTGHTSTFVSELTEGRLKWKPDVVVSPRAVTTVSPLGNNTFWLSPNDVHADIQEFAPLGKYDGVFFYWKAVNDNGRGLNVGFGWTIGPTAGANHAGFTSVHHGPTDAWGRDSETTEVFVHEWQHQLEAFYSSKGVKLPKGGLHVDGSYGYKHHPSRFWKPWYRDFLTGNVLEPDGGRTGLGEKAWALGTIRDEQLVYLPEYLTPERRKLNLLKNGSFEELELSNWTVGSWRGNQAAGCSIALDKPHSGKRVAVLSSKEPDDANLHQTVSVKPNTRYLFSGWARSADIVIAEKGGASGANLSVLGGFERSRESLVGTSDWKYLSMVIDSGDRTSLEIAARLGHHSSTASGQAWFDDLCLIELSR
jgi:hypothetical protein